MPAFGRIKDPVDNRDHPLAMHLAIAPATLPRTVKAPTLPVLDQGDEPQCVSFSGATYRTAQERRDWRRTMLWDENGLYADAKSRDGFPTEDGTTIRAGADALTNDGAIVRLSARKPSEVGTARKIAAYARCQTIDEVRRAIVDTRGCWLGIEWDEAWFEPGPDGVLPRPRGTIAGGHAIFGGGYSMRRGLLEAQNSWGTVFGLSGKFFIPLEYIETQLQSGDADAWSIVDAVDA